jgi:hypothetical protein
VDYTNNRVSTEEQSLLTSTEYCDFEDTSNEYSLSVGFQGSCGSVLRGNSISMPPRGTF